jgi:hypothetical protein
MLLIGSALCDPSFQGHDLIRIQSLTRFRGWHLLVRVCAADARDELAGLDVTRHNRCRASEVLGCSGCGIQTEAGLTLR